MYWDCGYQESTVGQRPGPNSGYVPTMLLAIDVGNTQTVLGLYEGHTLGRRWRIATESQRTGDELGALLGTLVPALDDVQGVCLSSTVPALVRSYEDFVERFTAATMLVLGPGVRTGVPVRS